MTRACRGNVKTRPFGLKILIPNGPGDTTRPRREPRWAPGGVWCHRSIPVAPCARKEAMDQDEFRLTVNGAEHRVTCEPDTPLLDVLRHDLGLAGPRFG